MNENIIKSPLLPDTIHFNHTMDNQTEVMRITRDGVWVNPDIPVEETARAVLDALSSQVTVLVQRAVEDEREACAKVVEADGRARGDEGLVLIKAAGRIRARGEKPPVKSYCGGKPNYCTPEETFTLDRGCYERGCVAYDERDGDGVNILGKCVDETAKGEHEPVAWRNTETGDFCSGGFLRKDLARWVPLYTAPPKREWVGLTDEEIIKCFDSVAFGQVEDDLIINKHVNIFRAIHYIEAKLKEKNVPQP